ncbi:ABC transporter substrate-binding protein [Haloarchaeobius amylolyticus]|uniref:ABC transporter substrate-binding protein n=1 Tax=Haloarchaeobius amylolyticus TaxID=1198296 RepID=UPI00226FDC02|nr:ABC transporter substrate-binding protein [Haloarchaeobius amylolyticus]
MSDETNDVDRPTRRDYLRYGGAVVGGSLLAGCTGDSDSTATTDQTRAGAGTATETTAPETEATTTEDTSYTASISPVGEVTFDEVPTNVMAYSPQYADMLVALGHADSLNSLGFPESYGKGLGYFLDAFDGVSIDTGGLTKLFSNSSFDKEILYELDSDVHLMDPAWLSNFDNWSKTDTEEIRNQIGPWFANRYSREHTQPPEGWRDGYRYYTIWEITERVADVFQERERFEALKAEYETLYGHIRANLPPKNERPTVGLVAFWEGKFYPYKISGPGFGKAHTRPMGARDAFADSDRTYDENYDAAYDYEGMLEVDPDVILHNFAVTPFYDWTKITKAVSEDPIGQELSAVKNDRFYASGQSFQGPLQNLLQLEMTAKQLYPDQFGEWPRFEEGQSYPALPEDEQLFDHQRVADIVTGDL